MPENDIDLKSAVIKAIEFAKECDKYQNPYFVHALLSALSDIYGYQNDELDEWTDGLWSR